MSSVAAFQTSPTATIANGGTKTGAIGFADYASGGFILPAAFTGVAITFEVSEDGTNFTGLYDSATGAIVTMTVAQGRAYPFPSSLFPWSWIKLVSGSSEGAARTIQLALKY